MSDLIVGAILAGGASRRMGREKATLVMPDGRTMIQTVYDALRPVCDEVVLVGANDVGLDLPRILDDPPGQGPLAAIDALLQSARGDWYVVVPCDMPGLTTDVLQELAVAAPERLRVVQVSAPDLLPLPLGVSALLRPVVADLRRCGRSSIRALLADRDLARVPARGPLMQNINRPDDLDRLRCTQD